jgi:hypothetical protein
MPLEPSDPRYWPYGEAANVLKGSVYNKYLSKYNKPQCNKTGYPAGVSKWKGGNIKRAIPRAVKVDDRIICCYEYLGRYWPYLKHWHRYVNDTKVAELTRIGRSKY